MNVTMKMIDFESLVQYVTPTAQLYLRSHNNQIKPISQLAFAPNKLDIILITGNRPITLSQLTTRSRQISGHARLLYPNEDSIFGFQLDITTQPIQIVLH